MQLEPREKIAPLAVKNENVRLQEQYLLNIAKNKTYICIRALSPITLAMTINFTKEFIDFGERLSIRRCFIDMQFTTSRSRIADKYTYAYRSVIELGLSSQWKVALLRAHDDKSAEFIEAIMSNARYRFRIFTEQTNAVCWLAV